jgi:hypothetical protein
MRSQDAVVMTVEIGTRGGWHPPIIEGFPEISKEVVLTFWIS